MKKNVTDNKAFWQIIKQFLSHKIVSNKKATLNEKDGIIESDI